LLDGAHVIAETPAVRRSDTTLDAVIGLGGNLGDVLGTFRATLNALAALGQTSAISSLYRTDPVGGPPQPDFLNAAVRLQYPGLATELMSRLLELERRCGRARRERWGPRTLDLDILWISGRSLRLPGVVVPHPRLHERAFALWPLLDVAPEAADPDTGTSYRQLAEEVGRQGLTRILQDWGNGPPAPPHSTA
jgi:2-amino-4-hydroxy-6-hydroxymethyldihydropteridine diphosphokinase